MRKVKFFNRRGMNIDIGWRCALDCPRCARWRHFRKFGHKVHGYDITMEEYLKVIDFFNHHINFSGQYSDPIHHPKFIDFLKINYERGIETRVHNASSHKPKEFFIKAFKANPEAGWYFGIDGLPEESHKYRINQDGPKLYDIMLESKKYLKRPPIWQYIIFSYNEHHVEEAREKARKDGVVFMYLQSSRWDSNDDELMPKNPKYKMSKK
tara:strand:- start:1870 stop:2499 length:630 start_codon:yes stop_codon:yes gene_type:complete